MEQSQHTPGPWAVDGEGSHVASVSKSLEITAPCVSRLVRPDDSQIEADARLIAAAPDLLAALTTALPLIEDYVQGRPEVAERIRAAISKAKVGV